MYPVWLNKSCDPFTAEGGQCIIGQYVEYSVDVATPEHIASTAKFAKDNNIRLIVKNSGHEYVILSPLKLSEPKKLTALFTV